MLFQQSSTLSVPQRSELISNFLYSLKSKATQEKYLVYIKYFEKFHQNPIDKLLSLDRKATEDVLIEYIKSMRDNGLSYSSIYGRIAAIFSFLDLNDISINQKKVKKFYGEHNKTIKDEAYTREDLQRMFEQASFRVKVNYCYLFQYWNSQGCYN